MKTKILKVKITFLEPVLGTWPSNQNVARDFIASKSPDAATIEDEVAALGADAVADKGMTVFPRNENGEPVLYDYQIKGFFKDSCGMLARVGGKTETGRQRERQALRLQEGHRRPDLPAAPHDPHQGQRQDRRLPAPPACPDGPG